MSLDLALRMELAPAVPAKRLLVPWLRRELVATDDARDRLRAWFADGGLDRPEPGVRDRVRFYGDREMLPAIVAAFDAMAPPARDFVLEQATIVGAGWSSGGWTGAFPPTSPRLIVVLGNTFARVAHVMLHEGAHVWLEPIPQGLERPADALDVEAVTAEATRDGWGDAFRRGFVEPREQRTRLVEARANALAAVWHSQLKQ